MKASEKEAPAFLPVLGRPRTGRHSNSQAYRPANRRFQEISRRKLTQRLPEILKGVPALAPTSTARQMKALALEQALPSGAPQLKEFMRSSPASVGIFALARRENLKTHA